MVSDYYGLKLSIQKLRTLTNTDCNGTTLQGMVEGAEKIGFNAVAVSGNIEELIAEITSNKMELPAVIHTKENHYVVLESYKKNKFYLIDPMIGIKTLSYSEFKKIWSGYTINFFVTGKFVTGNYRKGIIFKFLPIFKNQIGIFAGIFFLSLIVTISGLMSAYAFQTVIDGFALTNVSIKEESHKTENTSSENEKLNPMVTLTKLISNSRIDLNVIFMVLIGIYLLNTIFKFIRSYLLSFMARKVDIALILEYIKHLIDIPMKAIASRLTGDYMSRLSDISIIRSAISTATITIMLDSVMLVIGSVLLFLQNAKLFAISVLMVVLYIIIVAVYRRPISKINYSIMEGNALVQSYFKEVIEGAETIKANCAEIHVQKKIEIKIEHFINKIFCGNIVYASQEALLSFVEMTGVVMILWTGFGMVMDNVMTVGQLMTFYVLLSYFTGPIKNLMSLQPTIQRAIVAAERINDILEIEVEQQQGKIKEFDFRTIKFNHVLFRYGSRKLILDDISLEIAKGEKVALIGESGCGKTTLVKLLLDFYKVEDGEIKIAEDKIEDIDMGYLRSKIAYVCQDTFLFSDSIINNLKLGNQAASMEDVEEACRMSKADEFINNLPLKYHTYLEENGKNISSGQRQRLAIARALLKHPDILILDEATSNLDTHTENGIKNTISSLGRNITCIIIAHRLNTIKECDKIYVMGNKKILESGTHEELIRNKCYYSSLYKKR